MESSTKSKVKLERHRSDSLNMRIDPKLKYLAEIAARDQERTLSAFIERAVRRALTPESMQEEPTYGTALQTEGAPAPLWNEGLWDIDEADRFFRLATEHRDLLTLDEQRLWKLLSGSIILNHGKLTIEKFREYYNHPSIDTTHLRNSDGGE